MSIERVQCMDFLKENEKWNHFEWITKHQTCIIQFSGVSSFKERFKLSAVGKSGKTWEKIWKIVFQVFIACFCGILSDIL